MPKPPTNNGISQGRHGTYNAVDYLPYPDPTIYAPEDGRISNYIPLNGNMGNNLFLNGPTGNWAFSHLEKPLVTVGQNVRKGDAIGIMGYTGYVIPAGPQGRHVHVVLYKGGQWVYPPDHFNEPFHTPAPQPSQPTQGAIEMINNADEAVKAYKLLRPNYNPTQDEINGTAGRRSWLQFANDGQREREQRDAALASQSQALAAAQQDLHNVRQTLTEIQQLEAQEDVAEAAKDEQIARLQQQSLEQTGKLEKALLEVQRLTDAVCKVPEKEVPDTFGWITKLLSKFVKAKQP